MKYKFRFSSTMFRVADLVVIPVANFLIVYIGCAIIIGLLQGIGILQNEQAELVNTIRRIAYYVGIVVALLYDILPKGVYVKNDSLSIRRYTITFRNLKPIINIHFTEIANINVNYQRLNYTAYHGLLANPCGDQNYNVEITLNNGKKVFFSIYDQEKFVSDLLEVVNEYRARVGVEPIR